MRNIFFLFGILLVCVPAMGQTYEEWLKKEQEAQEGMKKEQVEGMNKLRKDYDDFVKKQDEEFAEFLKKRWTEFRIFQGELPPPSPKPKDVPVAVKKLQDDNVLLKSKPVDPDAGKLDYIPIPRLKKTPVANYPTDLIEGEFYGNKFTLKPDKGLAKTFTGQLDESGFSDYWMQMSRTSYDDLLDKLFELKERYGLNDWGYYMLVRECAAIFTKDENTRQLLAWFLLNKSGYIARVGYDEGNVALLLPADQPIYGISYITQGEKRFYMMRSLDKLLTYDGNFAGSDKSMDMEFPTALNFSEKYVKQRMLKFRDTTLAVAYNSMVTKFYDDYPATAWEVYFNAPVSAVCKESLAVNLYPFFNGLSKDKKVAVLLNLLHQSFPYMTDEEQFGREKYFFPEEILAYPYSDCEDRAAFFSSLVENWVGLPTIGLSYPGHVSVAVRMDEAVDGDYLVYEGEQYTACDPTYIGATIGMSMPQFAQVSAEIIPTFDVNGMQMQEEHILAMMKDAGVMVLNKEKSMVSDGKGNVYVTGLLDGTPEAGVSVGISGKDKDMLLTKINDKDQIEWTVNWTGAGKARPVQLKLNNGSLFLSGVFEGEGQLGKVALTADNERDIFMANVTLDGSVRWASKAGLTEDAEEEGYNYLVKFDQAGKVLTCEVQPDVTGMPESGLAVTRKNEFIVTGTFNEWSGISVASAGKTHAAATLDVMDQLKTMNDMQIQQKTDKSMAGLLAVISLINSNAIPVSGDMATKTMDKYNPSFKTRCPNIYKNIRKVEFIRNDDGIIKLKTQDGKPVNFDKVQVKDGSRMRTVVLPENNILIEIIDGIKVGKAFIWFNLNKVVLYHSSGDMVFDYDKDHTLRTFNLGKDILN